jgi:hypothetical protein
LVLDRLTIYGGHINATSRLGNYGIGAGEADPGTSAVHNLTIVGGTVNATGIGADHALGASCTSIVDNLTIFDGNINTSRSYGAIGSEYASFYGASIVHRITILHGNINASARVSGAGIGSGTPGVNGTTAA